MIILDGESLTIEDLIQVAREKKSIKIAEKALQRINKSRQFIDDKVAAGEAVYGVTTGFGELSNVAISTQKVKDLQKNLIRSHSVGVGPYLDEEIVRAMMLLRINTLVKGYSGIRLSTLETFIKMLNANILPLIPSQGSVGSSGDLAPLAHMTLGLIGEGEVIYEGKKLPAADAFKKANITPVELEAKEGLALINGTQLITSIGALTVHDAQMLAEHADIAAAFTTDMLKGTIAHTTPSIHKLRPYKGQKDSAAMIRKLILDSEVLASHKNCGKVQDAYSLRCAPQVHGASRDTIEYVKKIIETEMNSATDNPLVFPEDGKIISAGNFHGQPVALAMDFLGIAIAELANISERRIARITDAKLSECLPPFLIEEGGINSGFMITQYTAASLVSENKVLAHPASGDSVPTSANQEDHVSMGTIASRKCREILKNSQNVIGIELLCAAQALEFHRPLKTSPALERVHQSIRKTIPKVEEDRYLHPDLVKMQKLIKSEELVHQSTR